MAKLLLMTVISALLAVICSCTSHSREHGWYHISAYPSDSIIGEPLVTVRDFEAVVFVKDTLVIDGKKVCLSVIQGRVKPEKRQQWADGTEHLIGERLGFVYNDSVITAPQVNVRIESGTFEINSSDTTLLRKIYNSIQKIINNEDE